MNYRFYFGLVCSGLVAGGLISIFELITGMSGLIAQVFTGIVALFSGSTYAVVWLYNYNNYGRRDDELG